MIRNGKRFLFAFVAFSATLILCGHAAAASLRFDEPATYVINQTDAHSAPAVIGNSIRVTSGYDQTRSLWFKTPRNIANPFSVSFTYRLTAVAGLTFGQGLTFAVHNSASGLDAIGDGGSQYFGYQGIDKSIAVSLEVFNAADSTYIGSYTNGAVAGGGAVSATPIDARQGRDVAVSIAYDGVQLSVTAVDGSDSFGPLSFNVGSIASLIGSSTGYVGFTANTYGNEFVPGATQTLSDFVITPEPSCLAMVAAGITAIRPLTSRRRK
jgi:hypothetical protein